MTNVITLPGAVSLDSLGVEELNYHLLIAAGFTPDEIYEIVDELEPAAAASLFYDWTFWRRPNQTPPRDNLWRVCLLMGGRGIGKTWVGANWINQSAETTERLSIIGRTAADVRDTMVEGESGILATAKPHFRPKYHPAKRLLTWPNGARALCFSADEPDLLRGPQSEKIWADELAAWRKLKETWDNAMFGLRLGDNPQCLVTTTPRPIKEIKELRAASSTVTLKESTYNNVDNLAPQWSQEIIKKYEGTRLGRQELEGEVLEDNPNALWTAESIDNHRVTGYPEDLDSICIAIDPSASDDPSEETAETGIIAAGRKGIKYDPRSQLFILEDGTVEGAKPEDWAAAAIRLFYKLHADCIVAESNNGGAMIRAVIHSVDPTVPVVLVWASRGKVPRAEPVSMLYQQGRGHHVGNFIKLEDQMREWQPGMKSPDRMDAAVWAANHLMLGDVEETSKTVDLNDERVEISRY